MRKLNFGLEWTTLALNLTEPRTTAKGCLSRRQKPRPSQGLLRDIEGDEEWGVGSADSDTGDQARW